jgi:NAD+ synthase
MMTFDQAYSHKLFTFDMAGEVDRLCAQLRSLLVKPLKRRGLVVGISGGIDSSVCLALAVKALGPEKVIALQMPELHSAEETLGISGRLAEHFGVTAIHEDITPILQSVHFYERYNQAVQLVIPEYGQGWKSKITIPDIADNQGFTYFNIIAEPPLGQVVKKRLPLNAYLAIVAATNFKQRIRKMLEYYYADRMHYAVIGTPNRLEYDQGFFVKLGDGAADIKPIAHLYKTQVYMLADFLDVPSEIQNRHPTTDTYSLPQGQDEFYFSLPYERMDICLYGINNGLPITEVAQGAGLTLEQVERVYRDIETKRKTTKYLQLAPLLIGSVPEISSLW